MEMKVAPISGSEQDDPLVTSFSISTKEILDIIEAYKQRKLVEELDLLREIGGAHGLLEKLKSNNETGLSSTDDHSERISAFGINKPPEEKLNTYCQLCWEALEDTVLRILLVAGLAELILGASYGKHPEYGWVEGFAIIVAVLIVVNVTSFIEIKKQEKFSELKEQNRKAKAVTLLRDGIWSSVHPKELLVGDIIKLENGITVPADGILLEASQIEVVEAAMTGENDNIKKLSYLEALSFRDETIKANPNILQSCLELDQHHEIPSCVMLSGTNLAEGIGKMLVLAVGKNSAEGRLLELAEQEQEITPLMKKLTQLVVTIGKAGLYAAIVTVVTLYLRFIIISGIDDNWSVDDNMGKSLIDYFIMGITVLVVAIPEGLPMAVTISLAYSVKKMQKDQNLVRKMYACETMGGADMICSDKTGTLTQNKMTVSEFWAGGAPFSFEKNPPSHRTFQAQYLHLLKESIFTNTTAYIDPKRGHVGSKTEIAMLLLMLTLGHSDYTETRLNYFERHYKVFPFSSRRKRSSIVISLEDGRRRLHVKGAPEAILLKCSQFITAEGIVEKMDEESLSKVNTVIQSMTEKALRVIALAYTDITPNSDYDAVDENGFPLVESEKLILIGLAGIRDPLRDEVPGAVRKCQGAGITVRMVTGDNKATARAIAKECYIITSDDQLVLEGKDFNEITGGAICESCKTKICECSRSEEQMKKTGKPMRVDVIKNFDKFKEIVGNLAVLARSSPDDKYALVCGLKQMGHVVAVTGDGSNDAPALRKADIGFAMGIAGTEMAQEASGIILLDDNFNSIVRAVVWGRNIYDNIRCFLQFQITINIVAVTLVVVGAVSISQSPLTSVQLLWVNMIMDTLASLALATDPPSESHLKRKPYKKTDYIVEKTMWKHIFGQSILHLGLMFAMVFAGENFLPEFDSNKALDGHVSNGRYYGYDEVRPQKGSTDPTRHFTYIFNIFVLLQLFNEINCRKLRDEWNVFKGIHKNWLFISIVLISFWMQVLFVQVGYRAFNVHKDGLSFMQWLVSLAFGFTAILWRFLIVAYPSKGCFQVNYM